MNIEPMDYYVRISDFFDEEKQTTLHDMFESVRFKLSRNFYHLSNIEKIILQAKDLERNDYYRDIYMPIYFEIEGFLISLRSSVDMLLHLINYTNSLALKELDVNLYHVYNHRKLPKPIKNIFDRYTRPYNNPTWNFIYTFRNEIVHEKSIHQVLPIQIDLFTNEDPLVFFMLEDNTRELTAFFNNCLRFLDNFASQIFQAIELSLNTQDQ